MSIESHALVRALMGASALLLGCCSRTHYFGVYELLDGAPPTGDGALLEDDAGPIVSRDDSGVVFCGAAPCACANGIDDDGDLLVDGFDPECTGAFDQYEDSFATGVHGEEQQPKCQDCFFDRNSGSGDDGCSRPSECALDGNASGTGACRSCEVSAACAARCEPLVPNGCDCFGCCGVWRGTDVVYVSLRASCALDRLDDLEACPRCIQAEDCKNDCGPCELCPGRGTAGLPANCGDPVGPGYTCEESAICLDTHDCAPGLHYCQQGCCMDVGI